MRRSIFPLRGLLPFHDFPEGPDWWNRDEYLAVIAQMAKLRLNFLGFHSYPEFEPGSEPTIWIGLPQDVNPDGTVQSSFFASYHSTPRRQWGYATMMTSRYAYGSAQLFEDEIYSGEVMRGYCPAPLTMPDCNEVFNRAGALFQDAFQYAHLWDIKTCVGSVTPLIVPYWVRDRLRSFSKDYQDPAVVQELYRGMFQRIMRAHLLDYYWLWSGEFWTWTGSTEEEVAVASGDIQAAINAAQELKVPFQLAMCGWMLGPPFDRLFFDRTLPSSMPISSMLRELGNVPVDRSYAQISGRSKWVIPWLEDDAAMTVPQLWVGRVRRDAAAARKYGCEGLIGIHWRTRSIGPTMAALSQAAWDQTSWNPPPSDTNSSTVMTGHIDGLWASFPNVEIANTSQAELYRDVSYGMSAYWLPVPNGQYRVQLQFCEPAHSQANSRVFDVKLQGQTVLDHLDIFALAGKNRALDYAFTDIQVTNGWLVIDFVPRMEYPCIAAFAIENETYHLKVNCGGPAYEDYAGDWPPSTEGDHLPSDDFYQDWARQEFGPEAAEAAARIFSGIDGQMPRGVRWIVGPGDVIPNPVPWSQISPYYAFADDFSALDPLVYGAGNRARFEFWRHQFEYLRTVGQIGCVLGQYESQSQVVTHTESRETCRQLAQEYLVPLHKELIQLAGQAFHHLLATVSTTGDLGTLANWNQHVMPRIVLGPGTALATYLGENLPAELQPSDQYSGPTRVFVPTVRSQAAIGESLRLKVMVLSAQRLLQSSLYYRTMGQGEFAETPLTLVNRGVYQVGLPALDPGSSGLEYFIKVVPEGGEPVYFPATAPQINQTVILDPEMDEPRLDVAMRPDLTAWEVALVAEPGGTWVLESSTNMVEWLPLTTNSLRRTETMRFWDASSEHSRFYRARLQP